jgi:hypothetical protein
MRRLLVGFLLVLPLVTSGCIAPLFIEMFKDPYGRHDSLVRVQREYTNALRWNHPDIAAQFVHPDVRDEFIEQIKKFKTIRVTDYDTSKITWGEEQATATLTVTYRAYSMKRLVETEIRETQFWERLTKRNDWVVKPKIDELIDSVAGM